MDAGTPLSGLARERPRGVVNVAGAHGETDQDPRVADLGRLREFWISALFVGEWLLGSIGWGVLAEVFAAEPEVVRRLHELLAEIMVDELGHIGERRSFLGNSGVKMARKVLPVMIRRFFADIPEVEGLLDVDRMAQEALRFDYSGIDSAITARAWIPAYCQG